MDKQNEYRTSFLSALSGDSLLQRIRRGVVRTSWAVYDHSYVLLMVGIGCYKFLEWMYSDEGSAAIKIRHTGADAPVPPPPLPPAFAGNASVRMSTLDASTCPICQKRRVNPAASVSGFVFCYPCIYRHVEENGECPVTQIPCDVASIVKIYDDATA
jgi:peroxin-12